jgi:hypothetical protein
MKMVVIMYLEEDEPCVSKLMARLAIPAWSRMPVEGHGPRMAPGWAGEASPFQSRLIFSFLPDEIARTLVDAVAKCKGVEDPRHPIRAALLGVEKFVHCRLMEPAE